MFFVLMKEVAFEVNLLKSLKPRSVIEKRNLDCNDTEKVYKLLCIVVMTSLYKHDI